MHSRSIIFFFKIIKILSPVHKILPLTTIKKNIFRFENAAVTNGNLNQNKSIISHVRSLYSRNATSGGESYHSQINHLYGGIVRSHKNFSRYVYIEWLKNIHKCLLYSRWILKFMFGLAFFFRKWKKQKINKDDNISHHCYNVISSFFCGQKSLTLVHCCKYIHWWYGWLIFHFYFSVFLKGKHSYINLSCTNSIFFTEKRLKKQQHVSER